MERTDCRDARILLESLKYMCHTAKAGPSVNWAVYNAYVWQALEVAKAYAAKFGQTLTRAPPGMFMLVLDDLEHATNHFERPCALC